MSRIATGTSELGKSFSWSRGASPHPIIRAGDDRLSPSANQLGRLQWATMTTESVKGGQPRAFAP